MFAPTQSSCHISPITAIVLVCKGGIASDPFIIIEGLKCGVIQALIICLSMFFLTQFSFHVFFRTWTFGSDCSYSEIWKQAFGDYVSWMPILLIILSYVTFVVFHSYELFDNLLELLQSLWDEVPAVFSNRWFVIYVMAAVTCCPTLLWDKLVSFQWIAWLSLFSLVLGGICVFAQLIRRICDNGFDPDHELVFFTSDFSATILCLGNFNTAFFVHPIASEILKEMDNPTAKRCNMVVWCANGLSALVHYGIALLGYLCFTDAINDESIFLSMNGKDPEVIIGKISHYIVSACSNTFYTSFLAQQLSKFIVSESGGSSAPRICAGLVIISLALALNFFDEFVVYLCDLIGNIATLLLVFVLPSCFYLAEYKLSNRSSAFLAILLLFIGIPASVLITYSQI